jgi:hypothetical protein
LRADRGKRTEDSRALAVVGATLLSAGRFKEADIVLVNAIKTKPQGRPGMGRPRHAGFL